MLRDTTLTLCFTVELVILHSTQVMTSGRATIPENQPPYKRGYKKNCAVDPRTGVCRDSGV